MRIVDRPHARPMRCAAVPFIGQSNKTVRWIDTGAEMDGFDNHIYLSDVAVAEAAHLLGYPRPGELVVANEKIEQLEATVKDLQQQLDAANTLLKAVGTIEAAGLQVKEAA